MRAISISHGLGIIIIRIPSSTTSPRKKKCSWRLPKDVEVVRVFQYKTTSRMVKQGKTQQNHGYPEPQSHCGFRQLPTLAMGQPWALPRQTSSCVHGPEECVIHICTNLSNHDGAAVSHRVETRRGSKWFKISYYITLIHTISTWTKIERSGICIAHRSTYKYQTQIQRSQGLIRFSISLSANHLFLQGLNSTDKSIAASGLLHMIHCCKLHMLHLMHQDVALLLLHHLNSQNDGTYWNQSRKVEHDWNTHVGLEIVEY